ncbi:MAG: hypothetical protein KME04_01365 [Pleurocapsa minor GSE-CHR-MK-17-07R]|jgi:hypothetical protein|nr:hypothetical protein [Pleurocapsa minor GSE-CHR-MK 17-07R]
MGVISVNLNAQPAVQPVNQSRLWLRNRRWDLFFISLSVILVPLPYLVYLLAVRLGVDQDVARNSINGFVAVAVGGPHMMSTFMRTGLDKDFRKRYPMLLRSSIIIPIIVVSLAFLNLTLLLTVFFFWAAMHVLHQVTYISELYSHKEHTFVRKGTSVSMVSRLIDYGVILTCLFPFAALKISQGQFEVGTNDLTRVIPEFFQQTWFFYAMTGIFLVATTAFFVKTIVEYRRNIMNVPKTVFILLTVAVAFVIPSLPNLDTAFQGLNTWHSFQYLAITFYIVGVRTAYGKMGETAPVVKRFEKHGNKGLFVLSTIMLVGSAVVFIVVYSIAPLVRPGIDGNAHFDIAYYTAILSFLWIHYYHDHFLFTNFEALDDAFYNEKAAQG